MKQLRPDLLERPRAKKVPNSDLLESVKMNEGFEPKPYEDTQGILTFGYGLTWIKESEAEHILKMRLAEIEKSLLDRNSFLKNEPMALVNVLTEMEYQLGRTGLMGFTKMWGALITGDYKTAASEGMDSLWAKQTPHRAKRLMTIVRDLADA